MTADEILELLAHPRFIRLESICGGWRIDYEDGEMRNMKTMIDGTLDKLLARFAEVIGGEGESNGG